MKNALACPALLRPMLPFLLIALCFVLPHNLMSQCTLGSLTLNVVAPLNPEISGNTEICAGTTTTLSLTGTYSTYAWSTGSTEATIMVGTSNVYTVTVTNATGCSATDEIEVEVFNAPVPIIEVGSYQCGLGVELDAGDGFATYLWSTGHTTPTIYATTAGTYTVTVTNAQDCSGTATASVTIPAPPTVSITGTMEFCEVGSTILYASDGFSSYVWTGGSTADTLVVTASGNYGVTVTDAAGCTNTAVVTVTEHPFTAPIISGDLEICSGSTTLTAEGPNYVSYLWSSGQTTQGIIISTPNTYTVTVTTADGCGGSASATVSADGSASTTIVGNTAICNGASTTLTATGSFASYLWSNGQTSPTISVNQAMTYGVTVTTTLGCTGTAAVTVTEAASPSVSITPLNGTICESSAPLLLTASPAGGIWSGDVDADGLIDPTALGVGDWTANYAYTDANGCTGSAQLDFAIVSGTAISIAQAGPYCSDAPIETLIASPAGGVWGGVANAAGEVDPAALGAGMFTVTYTISPQAGCGGTDEMTIEVFAAPTATIAGSGTICEGSGQAVSITLTTIGNGPFELTYTIDNLSPKTLTVPADTTSLDVTAPGVYQITALTDVNGCAGTGDGQAAITVVGSPQVSDLALVCDPSQTNYSVAFSITGGDNASYTVTSAITGSLSGPPYTYTSYPIPSGSTYQFVVDDANHCNPITLSGTYNCNCTTGAGTMDLAPLVFCEGETAVATPLVGPTLDTNDVVVYMLHSNNSNSLGTVYATDTAPSFDFVPPFVVGQTYYISAVAGNDDSNGGVDLNDLCLSVSIGTPIMWTALPSGSLSINPANICLGETASLVFSLSGNAPFDVTYTDGTQTLTLQGILDGHSIVVSPTAPTTFTLLTMQNASPNACAATPGTSATITVHLPDSTLVDATSCNPAEVGVFTQVFTNQQGCDSTVILTVSFQDYDEVFLTETTCDPLQTGVFTDTLTNQYGCDSVVITTVSLLPSDLTELTAMTCDPLEVGVFTQTLTNLHGCDSVVVTTVSLLGPDECGVQFLLSSVPIPCGSTTGSLSIEVVQGQLPLAYSFTSTSSLNGSGTVSASPFQISSLPAGQYSVTLTAASGLAATEVVVVDQAVPPAVSITVLSELDCTGEPIAAIAASVVGDFPPYDLLWSNGAVSTNLDGLGAGSYEVTVSDAYGCEATTEVAVQAASPFEIAFTLNNPDCFDEDGGYVQVSTTGGNAPYFFSINGGAFQDDNAFGGLSGGAYQIVVQDATGCEATESFVINAVLLPQVTLGADTTIQLGDGITINAIVNLPDSLINGITWTGTGTDLECPTCLTQTTVPLVSTTYTVTVETEQGCVDSDGITVFVDKEVAVYAPNAFSPNGDGINDVFHLFGKEDGPVAKVNSLLIFSRWGESVFEAFDLRLNDPTKGWDGTHKGEIMNPAVFIWYAEVVLVDGTVKLLEGDVTLIK